MKRAAPLRLPLAVAVAVTDRKKLPGSSTTLQLLTTAALLLPGLQTACAQSSTLSVQTTRFEEGKRHTSIDTGRTPLQAWTLDLQATHPLSDAMQLDLHFTQDSWSGATPVATAPVAFGGNRARRINSNSGTVISGASPLLNGSVLLDRTLTPLQRDSSGALRANAGEELIMSSASPELRQQLDASLTHSATNRRLQLDVGFSHENDYRSRHLGTRAEFDFNDKLTTLAVGAGYTGSDISADIAGAWLPYVTTSLTPLNRRGTAVLVEGSSHESAIDAGLTQVLNRKALLDVGISVRNVRGLLENPYRAVTTIFVDPAAIASTAATLQGDVRALLEQRPDTRRIDALSARYIQHIETFNASLHVNYDYSHDDWDIRSHAIEVQWLQPLGNWLLAPHVRWYSQQGAWFHQDHLVSKQRYRSFARDTQGREVWLNARDNQQYVRTADGRYLDPRGIEQDPALLDLQPVFSLFSPSLLPAQYSSDPRLGGYGVFSTGVSIQRRFDNGLTLEAGIDRYRRASSLQFGGAGDTPYADFHYSTASLALTLDLQTVARRQRQAAHVHNHSAALPAGLLLSHDAGAVDSWTTGYRVQRYESMTMHMLDLAWQPSAQWTLMLMPQFMTMDDDSDAHNMSSMTNSNARSNFGDTLLAALWHQPTATGEWQLTTGIGIPGSGYGTADLLPAVQYRSAITRWNFGARLGGSLHLDAQHPSDNDPSRSIDSSLWIGTALSPSLSATLRASRRNAHYQTGDTENTTSLGAGVALTTGMAVVSLEWVVDVGHASDNSHAEGHSLFASWHLPL